MSSRMETWRRDVRKSPADLEQEADLARDAVEGTLHEIERRLSPSEIGNRFIGMVKLNAGSFSKNLLAQVQSNPVPAVLIAVGVAGLFLSKSAERRSGSRPARPGADDSFADDAGAAEGDGSEADGRWSAAVDAMYEAASGGSDATGDAESAIAMAGRTAANSVRSAADTVTDAGSRTATAARRAAHDMTRASKGGAQRLMEGYSYLSREQPLVLGALAVVVGAAIGAMLPPTDVEDGLVGAVSDETKVRIKRDLHAKAEDLQAAVMPTADTLTM